MRSILFAFLCSGIYMVQLFWGSTNGQYFEDPTRSFHKFEFDTVNRGSFNISSCLKDLMGCYELVRGDMICDPRSVEHDTICSVMRMYCHDYYGDYDTYGVRFVATEQLCRSDWWQQYS